MPNTSNIQVPPMTTMSEHIAAENPHPQYLLADNLVSAVNIQVSLEDLNNVIIDENTSLNNTVLTHRNGSWEPISVSSLLTSSLPYATTSTPGVVLLAKPEHINANISTTAVTPDILYPYFERYDAAIVDINARINSVVGSVPAATTLTPGIAKLATINDLDYNVDSTIVTAPLLNRVKNSLTTEINLKQHKLTAGVMIDPAKLSENSIVEVVGAQASLNAGIGIDEELLTSNIIAVSSIPPTKVEGLNDNLTVLTNRVNNVTTALDNKQDKLAASGKFTEVTNDNIINCTLKGGTNTEIDPNTGEINCTLSNISKLVGYISPAIIESTISEIGIKELTKGCLLLPFSYTTPDDKEYQVAIEWGLSNKISIKSNTHRYLMIDNYGYYKFKKIIYALLTPKPCDNTQSKIYKTNFTTDIIEFCKYNGSTAADNANADDEESIASILMYFNQNSTNDTHSIRCKWIVIGLVDKNDKWKMQFDSDVINGREKATKGYINGNSTFPIATGSGNSEKLYLLVDSGDNTIVLNDPEFTLSTEEETAGPVTVTITYDSEATFCAYSLDNETWTEVTVGSGVPTTVNVTFTNNGYIYAKCNKSIDGVVVAAASSDYEISNISNV